MSKKQAAIPDIKNVKIVAATEESKLGKRKSENMKLNVDNYLNSKSEWENIIDQCIIGRNAMRNRQILKLSLLDGMTYEQIAEMFDMSPRQISNIIYKCTQRLIKFI